MEKDVHADVTIIIPTCNSEKYINQTFESLINQKIKCKILIADGNSNDDTLSIIEAYRAKLNIEMVSYKDEGQSNAINKMVHQVKTNYFCWLNSDDILLPSAIEKLYNEITKYKNEKIAYASADNFIFNDSGYIKFAPGAIQNRMFVLSGVWHGPFPAILWNTQIFLEVGALNDSLHYCMDYEMCLRLAQSNKISRLNVHVNCILGGFRHHENGKTSSQYQNHKVISEVEKVETLYEINVRKKCLFKFLFMIINPYYIYRRYVGPRNYLNTYLQSLIQTSKKCE